ncbi:hypothetical protein ACPCHT_19385 [Nucisporomicrobium flavum]|uniref:hypothetical protein n=1 Tax=Nucisporomicrobium flavum TaxID=2785915 RepID=UPI0018F70038|nr:hypothetical protein [Nucisporomicrobium flavum]
MKVRLLRLLTVPLVLLGSLVAVTAPASATPARPCWTTGDFKPGTTVRKVDWDGNGTIDECFGIAPDRTIWHEWATSRGWVQMPGGGRADDTLPSQWPAPGYRRVVVYVANPKSHWYQDFVPGSGWTGHWYRCVSGVC